MDKSSPTNKSFEVPKQLVWEAYKKVKANKGAAGVDGQSIEGFEKDLKNNLYRIWIGCPRGGPTSRRRYGPWRYRSRTAVELEF